MNQEELKFIGISLLIAGMVMLICGTVAWLKSVNYDMAWALFGCGVGIIWATWSYWRRNREEEYREWCKERGRKPRLW